jgi:hypothetical protein
MSYQAANDLIISVEPLVHRLTNLSMVVGSRHLGIISSRLHLEVASVIASPWFGDTGRYHCDLALGLTARFRVILQESADFDALHRGHVKLLAPRARTSWMPVSEVAIGYVASAAVDQLQTENTADSYRHKLERIPRILGLRPGEWARTLQVSREGLRKWEAGGTIAPERLPDIDDLYEFAKWLSARLSPEDLPTFMHRRIPALGHQTPLDWLAARRLDDFRRVYRRAFEYQGA